MVREKGWRSKNESVKFGREYLKRSFEGEEAIAVIQVVGRGFPCARLCRAFPKCCISDHSSAP